MKRWLSKLVSLAKRGYAAYRAMPEEDRKRIEGNAKKLTNRVLKK
jgi:predicted RNA-binding protein